MIGKDQKKNKWKESDEAITAKCNANWLIQYQMIFFLKKILRYQQSWVHKQSTQLKQITVNRYITSCEMKDSSNSVSNFTKNFNGSSGLQKLIYVWKELNLPVIGEPKLSHWKLVPTSFCLVLTRTIEKKCWKSATHVFQHFFPIPVKGEIRIWAKFEYFYITNFIKSINFKV